MIWGMIFNYLEGRRCTEVLGAGLSISFIFSSGFAKTVGAFVMLSWGVSEWWMPFVVTCIFFIPLLLFIWLLDKTPPPSIDDERMRTKRERMDASKRKKFIKTFLPGLVFLIIAYIMLTALRDFRDNFASEIWTTLGYGDNPEIFTATEIPISIFVLVVMGSIMLVKNNSKALVINHLIIIIGLALIGISTILFERQVISAPTWMIMVGLGLYLGYVPFNSIFFDRLMASFQYAGTVGFIMYLADSFGYLGSVGVLLFKEFGYKQVSWLEFFTASGYLISIAGSVLILSSMIYFIQKQRIWSRKGIAIKQDVVPI
jgi:MFS family permease